MITMRVLLIYNPVSGILYRHRDALIKQLLVSEYPHIQVRWHITTQQGSFGSLHASEYDRIIVCGGDGTIKEVASWLLRQDSTVPLAIIPNGTANVLAQALDIPLNPRAAVAIALTGTARKIDVGMVNERDYFLIAAGCGFHSSIIKHTTRRMKRVFGFFAYLLGMVRAFLHIRPTKVFVSFDGHEREYRAESVFVSNFSNFFNITVNPNAPIDDGLLNVTIYRAISIGDIYMLMKRILTGQYGRDERFSYYKTKRVYIQPLSSHTPIQIDGELVPLPHLDISIKPLALTIVAKK